MPKGGRLLLKGIYDASGAGLVLTVEDEGAGIPQEELPELCQPFHGSFPKGSGLGLAIVHRIVTDYNGTIEFSSEVGRGTVVAVRLPARTVASV
jgi:two-component system sporulation sensor kinase A